MSTFKPKFQALPKAQLDLWTELTPVTKAGFVLYDGTALSLRLGHRPSMDFDFFNDRPLDKDALTVLAPSGEETVKRSFFGNIHLGRVAEPELTEDEVCEVASLVDLYGTKLKVLLQRIESKDYRDVVAIIQNGLPLEKGLAAAEALYGRQFQPAEALKALTYFEGGDLEKLSGDDRRHLIEAAAAVQAIEHLQIASERLSAQ